MASMPASNDKLPILGQGGDSSSHESAAALLRRPSKSKVCLLVRHSEDADPRLSLQPDERWKDDAHSMAGRDPVLTANGIIAARGGFTDEQARNLRPGYRGVRGGIQSKIMAFQPTLVVTSPLRRSLLTAAFSCEKLSSTIPMIAHPRLRELKSLKVHARSPNHVKPGAHGVPFQILEETLSRAPRGAEIDLSLIPKGKVGSWHDVGATPEESRHRAILFLDWLRERPEERVVIFTHGKVLRLQRFGGINFLHGEVRRFHFDGYKMVHDPSFNVDAFEANAPNGVKYEDTKQPTIGSGENAGLVCGLDEEF